MNFSSSNLVYNQKQNKSQQIYRQYISAKEISLELLNEISLYIKNNLHEEFRYKVEKVISLVTECQQIKKGEIYLYLANSIIRIQKYSLFQIFKNNFFESITNYLESLVVQNLQQKCKTINNNRLARQTYSGKINKTFFEPVSFDRKQRILDLIIIERIDRVLMFILKRQKSNKNLLNGFSRRLIQTIKKSIAPGQRFLSSVQFKELKNNIGIIIQIFNQSNKQQKPIQISTTRYRHIIISKYDFLQAKNEAQNDLNNQNNKQQSSYANRFGRSAYKLSANRQYLKKDITQSPLKKKRDSLSLKRNSITKVTSRRITKKGSNNLNLQQFIPTDSKNKLYQASNFNRGNKNNKTIIQKTISNDTFENDDDLNIEQMQPIVNIFQKSLSFHQQNKDKNNKQFYIFLVDKTNVLAAVGSIVKNQTITFLDRNNDNTLTIKIKMIRQQYGQLFCNIEKNNQITLNYEQIQEYPESYKDILKDMYFYRNQLNFIKVKNQSETNHSMVIKINNFSQGILMGFTRLVSTYFISVIYYNKNELTKYHQLTFRKRMLQNNKHLKKQIQITYKLMDSELVNKFQKQQQKIIKIGPIFEYIKILQLQQPYQYIDQHQYYSQNRLIQQHNHIQQIQEIKLNIFQDNIPTVNLHKNKEIKEKNNKNSMRFNQGQMAIDNQFVRQSLVNNFLFTSQYSSLQQSDAQSSISLNAVLAKENAHKNKKDKKQIAFIQTIKTDNGYKSLKIDVKQQITGIKYNFYYGFKQKNPRKYKIIKNLQQKQQEQMQLYKSSFLASKRIQDNSNSNNNKIKYLSLINFIKRIELDNKTQSTLICQIKILPNQQNYFVFVQTYWPAKQKYYIFIINQELFQKITDINVKDFATRPFLNLNDVINNKKRNNRTSMMNYTPEDITKNDRRKLKKMNTKALGQLKGNFTDNNKNNEANFKFIKKMTKYEQAQSYFQIGTNRSKAFLKYINQNSLKASQYLIFKKEIISKLRVKVLKFLAFKWKNYKLYLQFKNIKPLYASELQNCANIEGFQLAKKNVYSTKDKQDQLHATELILIKYNENNLANINIFNPQALNKIYLQHLIIFNNQKLHGKYIAAINCKEAYQNIIHNINYKFNNHFFQPSHYKSIKTRINSLKSKNSYMQQQKKFQYSQLIQIAKQTHLNIRDIQKKKKSILLSKFIISNRYAHLYNEQRLLLVKIEIQQSSIMIYTLQDELIKNISIRKLKKYYPFVGELLKRTNKRRLCDKILKDQELVNLCCQSID